MPIMASMGKIVGNFTPNLTWNTQHKITEAQKNAIMTAFYKYDETNKGYLSRNDTKAAIISLCGYKPSKYEINQMYGAHDVEGLDLEMFMEHMSLKFAAQDEDDLIRQTFLMFDSQCRGFLTQEDLAKVLGKIAPHMPAHTIASSFREIDRDGDGRVSYKDFEFMMKYSTEDGF